MILMPVPVPSRHCTATIISSPRWRGRWGRLPPLLLLMLAACPGDLVEQGVGRGAAQFRRERTLQNPTLHLGGIVCEVRRLLQHLRQARALGLRSVIVFA